MQSRGQIRGVKFVLVLSAAVLVLGVDAKLPTLAENGTASAG